MQKQAPPPSSIVPGIPKALDEIVLAALARDRTRRPATAEDMAMRIDAVLEGSYGASNLAKLVSSLMPAEAAAVDEGAPTVVDPRSAIAESRVTAPARGGARRWIMGAGVAVGLTIGAGAWWATRPAPPQPIAPAPIAVAQPTPPAPPPTKTETKTEPETKPEAETKPETKTKFVTRKVARRSRGKTNAQGLGPGLIADPFGKQP
jgi:hypothetical protein